LFFTFFLLIEVLLLRVVVVLFSGYLEIFNLEMDPPPFFDVSDPFDEFFNESFKLS